MSVAQEPEVVVDMVIALLRSKMDAELAAMRTDRHDPRVSTEKPLNYMISEKFDPLSLPGIYVIADDVDFQNSQKEANYISAKLDMHVNCVVGDKDTELLTRKSYRYMGVLRRILHQANLTSANNKAKIVIVVEHAGFTPIYTKAQKEGAAAGVFMKECSLTCKVSVMEAF
jgi:hypothetical protein